MFDGGTIFCAFSFDMIAFCKIKNAEYSHKYLALCMLQLSVFSCINLHSSNDMLF